MTSLELIEIFSIHKVSVAKVSSCSNTGSMRYDLYWASRKGSLDTDTGVIFFPFSICSDETPVYANLCHGITMGLISIERTKP